MILPINMFNIYEILFFIIICALVFKLLIYKIETLLLFHPTTVTENYISNIISKKEQEFKKKINSGIELKRHSVITPDCESIDLLYFINPKTNKVILYSHGNAGNIYNHFSFIRKFGNEGSIVMYDYRGYGTSSGEPSEKGFYIDIKSVWDFVIDNLKINPQNIILYGESLGCSMSAWLGKELVKNKDTLQFPKGIIIQSGFFNLKQMVSDFFSKYLTWFVYSKFDNINYVKKINNEIPILVIHSLNDELISIKQPHKLVADGKLSKDNFIIVKGSHNSPIYTEPEFNKLKFFLNN